LLDVTQLQSSTATDQPKNFVGEDAALCCRYIVDSRVGERFSGGPGEAATVDSGGI